MKAIDQSYSFDSGKRLSGDARVASSTTQPAAAVDSTAYGPADALSALEGESPPPVADPDSPSN
jgi:hypothetical protein